jgi:hypothetical protein
MGLLDDVLGSAVPGGGLAKPLMIAATALLAARATGGLSGLLGGSGATPPNQPPGMPNQPPDTATSDRPAAGRLSRRSGQPGGAVPAERAWRRDQLVDRVRAEPADHAGSAASGARTGCSQQPVSHDWGIFPRSRLGVVARPPRNSRQADAARPHARSCRDVALVVRPRPAPRPSGR